MICQQDEIIVFRKKRIVMVKFSNESLTCEKWKKS